MGCNHIESRRMRRELAEVDFDATASYQLESKELCKNCRTSEAPVTLAKNIFLGDSGSKDATVYWIPANDEIARNIIASSKIKCYIRKTRFHNGAECYAGEMTIAAYRKIAATGSVERMKADSGV